MNRRIYLIAVTLVVLALALTACMSDGFRNDSQVSPTATADYAPNGNGANNGNGMGNGANNGTGMDNANNGMGNGANNGNTGNTASTSNGALAPFDWANNAADIEKAIGGISEISESRVVVTNSTALVGVKFDNAYKGQMTERIREMVAAEVMKADPTIQTVAVTSDEADVQKVYQLSDQIRAGRTADELSQDINAIVRNATTLR